MKNTQLEIAALIAILGIIGYTLTKKDAVAPPPPAVTKIDPQKIKNRHEVIRFYERAIVEIQEGIGSCSRVIVHSSSATNYDALRSATPTVKVNGESYQWRMKQIDEYKRRIAVMKAEIGE